MQTTRARLKYLPTIGSSSHDITRAPHPAVRQDDCHRQRYPSVLDTLKELADALGNDPSFATTIATQIANRVRYDEAQVLTAPQKAQACDNIGAASLVATGNLDRDFAAAYTAAKV